MSIKRTLILTVLLACSSFGFAASLSASDDQGLACFEELALPKYPSLARQARIEGDVILGLGVDQAGRLTPSVIPEAPALLKAAVEMILNTARLSKSCDGKNSRLVFSFQLDPSADPRSVDDGTIIIRWPDRIILRAATFPMSGSHSIVPSKAIGWSGSSRIVEGLASLSRFREGSPTNPRTPPGSAGE